MDRRKYEITTLLWLFFQDYPIQSHCITGVEFRILQLCIQWTSSGGCVCERGCVSLLPALSGGLYPAMLRARCGTQRRGRVPPFALAVLNGFAKVKLVARVLE